MMKIPDEFMQVDPKPAEEVFLPPTNHAFKPARRREVRRQRPQRHTTAVGALSSDVRRQPEAAGVAATRGGVGGCLVGAASVATGLAVAEEATLVKGESTGGLNRTLHPHSEANHISRWYSVAKISSLHGLSQGVPRRGSLKLPLLPNSSHSREPSPTTVNRSGTATPTAPSTPTNHCEDQVSKTGITLPSAATVVRALSPLLTPAFAAANNMALRASKMRQDPGAATSSPAAQTSTASTTVTTSPATATGAATTVPSSPYANEMAVQDLPTMTQGEFEEQYDIVQKIGEGWYSRVYLTEHRSTHHELVLKAVNNKNMSVEEFLREFHHSLMLGAHQNILTVFPDMVFSLESQCCMFASEYAPLGDLTSNINDLGIGEVNSKRVARQVGSALDWMHSKNLCHLDVKLDNILVFRSDFSRVKLCDFGSVKSQGDIVIKKNELLPYCPPELVAKHANEYYQVDRVQDVFQFGIVVFFCLFGKLPWQRADSVADPNFHEFNAWRRKKTSKVPKNFKLMSSRGQKLFKKLLDPDPERRLRLAELPKMTGEDVRWLRRPGGSKSLVSSPVDPRYDPAAQFLSDGISQLTMGSFQSVHSNVVEKNKVLSTLLQHGVETTVDRTQKNSRIINWIQNGRTTDPAEQEEMQSRYKERKSASLSSSGVGSDEVNFSAAGNNSTGVKTVTAEMSVVVVPGSSLGAGETSCTDDVDSGNYH